MLLADLGAEVIKVESPAGASLFDIVTGQHAAIGILAALHQRQATGQRQHVETLRPLVWPAPTPFGNVNNVMLTVVVELSRRALGLVVFGRYLVRSQVGLMAQMEKGEMP